MVIEEILMKLEALDPETVTDKSPEAREIAEAMHSLESKEDVLRVIACAQARSAAVLFAIHPYTERLLIWAADSDLAWNIGSTLVVELSPLLADDFGDPAVHPTWAESLERYSQAQTKRRR